MTPKFEIGSQVQMSPSIVAAAPAYAGRTYTILAASAAWGIGQSNDWYGDYVVSDDAGNHSVTRESCLVLAQ